MKGKMPMTLNNVARAEQTAKGQAAPVGSMKAKTKKPKAKPTSDRYGSMPC